MDNKTSMDPRVPETDFDELRRVANESVDIAKRKNAEYGSSWCKRGGVGAFFTIWRKADRLETQLKAVGYDMFDLTVDPNETESLDETLKDLANYLYLAMEKRRAIYQLTQSDLISDQIAHKLPENKSNTIVDALDNYADSLRTNGNKITSSWSSAKISSEETILTDINGEGPITSHSGLLSSSIDASKTNIDYGTIHKDVNPDIYKIGASDFHKGTMNGLNKNIVNGTVAATVNSGEETTDINMIEGDVLTVFRNNVMLNSFHGKARVTINQNYGRFVADCHGNISVSGDATISVKNVVPSFASSDGYQKLLRQIQEAQIDSSHKALLLKNVQSMYDEEFGIGLEEASIKDEGVPTKAYVNQ